MSPLRLLRRTDRAAARRRGAVRAPWGMLLLAWMLVAVQTLGLVHRSAHLHSHGQAAMLLRAAGQLPSAAQAQHDAAASVLARLFGHDDDGSGHCQLYDQLAHADLLCGTAMPVVAERVALAPPPPARAIRVARTTLPFQARAPPPLG